MFIQTHTHPLCRSCASEVGGRGRRKDNSQKATIYFWGKNIDSQKNMQTSAMLDSL